MARLRQVGIPFGISITATSANCEQILSDSMLDFYFREQCAFYAFIFQYMPIGRYPDLDWMPTPEQRLPFWKRSWDVVRQRQLFLLDFWNHGPMVEGCIAAGRDRGYLHIDWNGNVMPCVFMPYAAANLPEIYGRGGTLNDVLAAPLLRAVRQWQSEYGYGSPELSEEANWMLPCPFRDHFSTLHNWVETLNPKPEEGVAPAALQPSLRADGSVHPVRILDQPCSALAIPRPDAGHLCHHAVPGLCAWSLHFLANRLQRLPAVWPRLRHHIPCHCAGCCCLAPQPGL